MPLVSIDIDMKRVTNEAFLKQAVGLEPELIRKTVKPTRIVHIDEQAKVTEKAAIEDMPEMPLGKGDSMVLDFGNHQVGYVTFKLKTVGSPQDAPVYLRLKFGEMAKEITEDSSEYDGWISRSWIQEEYLHLDVLPATITLPRRYAFRYLEIYTVDTSMKFQLVVEEVTCETVSSVDEKSVEELDEKDELLKRMDEVSLRTLQNCMQSVFEDGPKRDRRLWLGDLRLQALANYATFKNYDMVRRCLYLFAALTRDDGAIGACLFLEPEYLVDDTFFFDYSLFFVSVLKDYYQETKDIRTAMELWPSAYKQIELSLNKLSEEHLIEEEGNNWCFVDWKEGLDKQAAANAILIYALNDAIALAGALGKQDAVSELEKEKEVSTKAVLRQYWDEEQKLFVSGEDSQISYASQVWMVLAGVKQGVEARELMNRVIELKPEMGMVTPYMNHHFVEALLLCGEKEKAKEYMKYYWGGMLSEGADTFWELYNPENPEESPYGSSMVNSYCHAWSCTPTYLLRRLF